MLEPLPPIEAAKRLREVDEALVVLLRRLGPEDWQRPAAGSWRVRDVAAHLLDGSLRRLSLDRDRHQPPTGGSDPATYEELVRFLNELNATWVEAAARFSPAVITELLAFTDPLVADYLESLDPEEVAVFSVAWAGESESKVWMDVAREFVERWHHQQQIRQAVDAPALDQPRYLRPLLDTCARALPRAYDG
ncbi:MAG: maleylpyruvate isomerase N-terminal domain-containing protein, partial [Thermoanaerobaculia bacterium]|nr:maleylpyruvate isomerase N-terminal domain-containing protein [Thermoanaerobaculia bacterium]